MESVGVEEGGEEGTYICSDVSWRDGIDIDPLPTPLVRQSLRLYPIRHQCTSLMMLIALTSPRTPAFAAAYAGTVIPPTSQPSQYSSILRKGVERTLEREQRSDIDNLPSSTTRTFLRPNFKHVSSDVPRECPDSIQVYLHDL
jgi:hypothetical protein